MLNKNKILGSLASLGLLFGTASGVAEAQMPAHSPEYNTNQFRPIEQPLELKVIVTIGGLALVGLELWWFLLSKTKSMKVNQVKE